jgi:hypothetical protein
MTPHVAAAGVAWIAANSAGAWAFSRALTDPARAQQQLLRRYLRDNADTVVGRRYGFAGIRTIAEYQARVPIVSYRDLEADLDRVARGKPRVLTCEPVRRLALSSGSVAAAKRVPCTSRLQREFRRAIAPWMVDLFRQHPRAALGRAYWSITPSAAVTPSPAHQTVPLGFEEDSEYVGGLAKHLVDATLAVPGAVRLVQDIEAFRYLTLLALLRCRDLSLVSVWHPSFFTLLLDVLPRHWNRLVEDVARGGARPPGALPAVVARAFAFRRARGRAAELSRIGPTDCGRLWPSLAVVSCWADGHAALYAGMLRQRLPGVRVQPKGLLATEGVVTIPFRGRTPLAVRSHFFEFLSDGRAWPAHEIEPGRAYSVVLTTGGGLYRYRLDDRVEVDGFVERTPSLRFLGKEDHVSDLCGEKLNETFVAHALARVFAAAGLSPRYAFVAPERAPVPPRYVLYVDADGELPSALAAAVDDGLAENPQYRWCRALGQLGPVRVVRAPTMYARYAARCRAAGQRFGDIKPLALSTRDGWREVFEQPTSGVVNPGEPGTHLS